MAFKKSWTWGLKGTVLLTPLDTYNYSPILNAFDDFKFK